MLRSSLLLHLISSFFSWFRLFTLSVTSILENSFIILDISSLHQTHISGSLMVFSQLVVVTSLQHITPLICWVNSANLNPFLSLTVLPGYWSSEVVFLTHYNLLSILFLFPPPGDLYQKPAFVRYHIGRREV